MRIIAGNFRGRKLNSPQGLETRPTSDRLREAIFSSLSHKFESGFVGLKVADIFAGTGAMGLEAISRGATSAVFVEKHKGLELVKSNAEKLGCADKCVFLGADARNLPTISHKLDLVFLDPPYGRELAEPALLSAKESGWLNCHAIAVIELAKNDSFTTPQGFSEIKQKTSSKSKVIYLQLDS